MISPHVRARFVLLRGLFGLSFVVSAIPLEGQVAPSAPTGGASAAGELVKLSAFEVTSDKDKGYSSSHAVGATRTDTPLNELPQAISVINQQYIRDWVPDNVMEAGKFVSGVTIAPTQMIRGLSGISPAIDGLSTAGNYDMSLFERVEFLKGPSSIIYGDGNKSGVISRASKKPLFDRSYNRIDLDIGSWDFFRATVDTTRPVGPGDKFSYRFIGSYMDRKGEKDDDYGRRRSLAPMFGWRIAPRTTVFLQISDFYEKTFKGWGDAFVLLPYNVGRATVLSSDVGVPRKFSPTEPYSFNKEQTRRYSFIVDQTFADWWSARLTASDVDHLNTERTAIPRDMINATQMQRSWRHAFNPSKATNVSIDSVWNFNLGPTRHKLLAFGSYSESEGGATQYLGRSATGNTTNVLPLLNIFNPVYGGEPASIFLSSSTKSEGKSMSVSFQEQAYLFKDRLILQGGIRYTESGPNTGLNRLTGVRTTGQKIKDWSDPKSVLGGVFKVMRGLSVYGSRSEIFTDNAGVQPDGSLFSPNVSRSEELGVKIDLWGGKVSALVNTYRRRELNRIILHPDPAQASLGFRLQVPGDELTGYEVDAYLMPTPELMFGLSYTGINTNNLGGLYTRSLPDRQYSVMARYEFSRGRLKNLALGLAHLYYDERPGDAANSFYLDAYRTTDAFASYSRGQYRFQLNVSNLADADAEYTSISRNIVSLQPARRFMVRVSREF
jgi:iron complex outermembrane receptor protein